MTEKGYIFSVYEKGYQVDNMHKFMNGVCKNVIELNNIVTGDKYPWDGKRLADKKLKQQK